MAKLLLAVAAVLGIYGWLLHRVANAQRPLSPKAKTQMSARKINAYEREHLDSLHRIEETLKRMEKGCGGDK